MPVTRLAELLDYQCVVEHISMCASTAWIGNIAGRVYGECQGAFTSQSQTLIKSDSNDRDIVPA